jgi:hypothetical protein
LCGGLRFGKAGDPSGLMLLMRRAANRRLMPVYPRSELSHGSS